MGWGFGSLTKLVTTITIDGSQFVGMLHINTLKRHQSLNGRVG